MQIAKEEQLTLLLHLLDELLQVKYCWMLLGVGIHPDAIKVVSRKRTASVTINHAIRVHHWHDFDDEVVTEHTSTQTGTDQIIYYAFHHE